MPRCASAGGLLPGVVPRQGRVVVEAERVELEAKGTNLVVELPPDDDPPAVDPDEDEPGGERPHVEDRAGLVSGLRPNREAKRHRYELLYTTGDGDRALPGLIDVAELRRQAGDDRPGFEARRSGSEGDRSGSRRPAAGPGSGHGRSAEIDENTVFASGTPPLDGAAAGSMNGA